jgi:surface carbohydrate biosynthesis protein
MEPILYLGLEIKQRELESRLNIALHALNLGFPVLFGQQWALFQNAESLPPGVILFKTVNNIQATSMALFVKHGHLVAATDEEVLVCFEDACFFEVFSPVAADNCHLFFAQSKIHRNAIGRRFPQLAPRTAVVGNSRMELLSPRNRGSIAAEADALRQAHGPYILFNTNYGQINSIWTDMDQVKQIAARAGLLNAKDPASVAEYEKKLEWELVNRAEIVEVIRWTLENMTSHNVVLRPHPGERPEYWQELFGSHPRFKMIARSSPHPWIMGAELLVHTTCTTGLEAALLDKPDLNIVPVPHPSFDYITNYVNPVVKNWRDAATAIEAFLRHGTGPIAESRATYAAALDQYFPGHRDGNSSDLIAKTLLQLARANDREPRPDLPLTFREPGFRRFPRPDILKDKFTLDSDEFVEHLRNAMNRLGLSMAIKIAKVDDSLFYLTR